MGEHCQICGIEYGEEYGYIYSVPDKLWEKVTGIKNGSGLRCIHCFSREARDKGIYIQWNGEVLNDKDRL